MTEVEFVQVLERIGKQLEAIKEALDRLEARQQEISWRVRRLDPDWPVLQELKEPL